MRSNYSQKPYRKKWDFEEDKQSMDEQVMPLQVPPLEISSTAIDSPSVDGTGFSIDSPEPIQEDSEQDD